MRTKNLLMASILTAVTSFLSGCYEESGSAPATVNAPPPKPGPLTSVGQQPASSALGKAKQSATNTIDRAEQKSRETADLADELMNPGGTPDRPPADPPTEDPGR
jgi:hypothetical protein